MSNTNQITPPLAVHFIWHPCDNEAIFPVITEFRRYLTRDIERPFSRELNIPTFLYSPCMPKQSPHKLAQKDVIFLFTSTNTLMDSNWKQYIDNIPNYDNYFIIPVAIEPQGMSHSSSDRLKNYNFIRAFGWSDKLKKQHAILALSHELYRFGLRDIDTNKKGIDSSIKLFLSHAKKGDTGLRHAEAIKLFIDNSNMTRFFDANEISPGFRFDEEIEKHIQKSTLVAIASDAYSSRYWCQREILSAKKEKRPIILVNSLENYEDRVFPAASNVPCVHITSEPLDEKNILRILIAALLETIRFKYAELLLKYYQQQGWIEATAHIFARPPEMQEVLQLCNPKEEGSQNITICYPEPPLYKEEAEWAEQLGICVSTPLWSSAETCSGNLRIGLSISDYTNDRYGNHYQDLDELKRFSQSLARHLLARENTLIYGGDLRDEGFTQFILDEASVLRDRLQVERLFVENYLAWPLHTKKENMKWYANYFDVVEAKPIGIPTDVQEQVINKENFLPLCCPKNKYIWSRCLTKMREESIKSSDVRIFAGGKLAGYLGKMPGVLEEFLIAYQMGKPIFLVGGLGGLVKLLCQSIEGKNLAEEFTEKWQLTHNEDYKELQNIAKSDSHHANFNEIKQTIESIEIDILAKRVGLSLEEYQRIMETPFIDESIHLVLKGLRTIKGKSNGN